MNTTDIEVFLNFSVWLGETTSVNALQKPIQVPARVKALVYRSSLAGIAGSNPEGGMDICLL
jgi:hypothetical protein